MKTALWRGLLDGLEFDTIAAVTGRTEIETSDVSREPQMCVVGLFRPDFPDVCQSLREKFPESRIVLLDTLETDILVQQARAQRLDGCLSLDLEPELVLSGLRLIEAGTNCFPQDPQRIANDLGPGEARQVQLTPREKDVLALIGEGMANKMIARELTITESTVKAHLNAVLRKTGTSNRTQANSTCIIMNNSTGQVMTDQLSDGDQNASNSEQSTVNSASSSGADEILSTLQQQ